MPYPLSLVIFTIQGFSIGVFADIIAVIDYDPMNQFIGDLLINEKNLLLWGSRSQKLEARMKNGASTGA